MLAPIYLGFFITDYSEKITVIYKKKWVRIIWKLIAGVNVVFLLLATFRAANPAINFYQYVWKNKINELNIYGENPYTMLGLKLEFYKKKTLHLRDSQG